MSEIDITVPRESIYREFESEPGPCPRCGNSLQRSSQTYLVATRQGSTPTDPFIMGSDFGWFCPACPTVVINPQDVSELLSFGRSDGEIGTEFVVIGIVDLDAIPPEKAHLPLGGDNNPIPLVQFTNIAGRDASARKRRAGQSKSGSRKKRSKPVSVQTKRQRKKRKRRKR